MKHLLTLLLFISTSVMAESFYLICDGTEEQYTRDNESFKIQKSLGIEVTDNK